MRKTVVFLTILLVSVLISACSAKSKAAEELIDYYNEEWVPLQEEKEVQTDGMDMEHILHQLSEGTDKETEELLREELVVLLEDTYIPMMDDVIEGYQSIELEHEDIQELNEMVIETEKVRKKLLEKMILVYKDEISEEELAPEQEELRITEQEDTDYLEELMDDFDVEYDEESTSIDGFYLLKKE